MIGMESEISQHEGGLSSQIHSNESFTDVSLDPKAKGSQSLPKPLSILKQPLTTISLSVSPSIDHEILHHMQNGQHLRTDDHDHCRSTQSQPQGVSKK